jgi:hypothetical protein
MKATTIPAMIHTIRIDFDISKLNLPLNTLKGSKMTKNTAIGKKQRAETGKDCSESDTVVFKWDY